MRENPIRKINFLKKTWRKIVLKAFRKIMLKQKLGNL